MALMFKYFMIFFFFKIVDSRTEASHLSKACLPVPLFWIARSRKRVILAKKRNLIRCGEGQVMSQLGV